MYWKVLLGQVGRLLVQPSIPCPGKKRATDDGYPGAPRVRTKAFFERILWFERPTDLLPARKERN